MKTVHDTQPGTSNHETPRFTRISLLTGATALVGASFIVGYGLGRTDNNPELASPETTIGCASHELGQGESLDDALYANIATLERHHNFPHLNDPNVVKAIDAAKDALVPSARLDAGLPGANVVTCVDTFTSESDSGNPNFKVIIGVDESHL